MLFEGCCTALVTPFDGNGAVNYYSLKNLIDYQIANNTKAICILGTTGESATITDEERSKIIKFCVCIVNGRVPLIVGTGSNSTAVTIRHSIEAEELGADGVLVVTPYYNKCNQNGLFEHFKAISNSVKIHIIIYNIPSRTGVNILPQTVKKLSKIKNIVGIKEASGNLSQIAELISILPQNFAVYSGDDNLTLPLLSIGAKGVISVTANCYPDLVQNLCEYCKNYDFYNAQRSYRKLYNINKALFLDVNPICIKFYMNLLGLNVGLTRLPLTLPNAETIKKLKEILNEYEN